MGNNPGYTRRTELSCTLEEMTTYGAVVLYKDEVIYVKQPDGRSAIKIGDGETPLADLPYAVNYTEIATLINNLATASVNATAAADRAEAAAALLESIGVAEEASF